MTKSPTPVPRCPTHHIHIMLTVVLSMHTLLPLAHVPVTVSHSRLLLTYSAGLGLGRVGWIELGRWWMLQRLSHWEICEKLIPAMCPAPRAIKHRSSALGTFMELLTAPLSSGMVTSRSVNGPRSAAGQSPSMWLTIKPKTSLCW